MARGVSLSDVRGLEVTVLGCGTSTGVPVIACDCAVCVSGDPRNQRLRPSVRIDFAAPDGRTRTLLIDTSTDLRQQALRFGLKRVDAVLYTHAHADHTFGIDELRTFNFRQGRAIPCYGNAHTLARIRESFSYIFEAGQEGGGKPKLELHTIGPRRFELFGIEIVPVPIRHGELEVYGYRLGGFAYVTDCHLIPEDSFALLDGVEVLILDALRWAPPHPTHFTIPEAVAAARRIGARQTYLTHLTHDVDAAAARRLPEGIDFAHDGLRLLVRRQRRPEEIR